MSPDKTVSPERTPPHSTFEVHADDSGKRLDVFLSEKLGISRRHSRRYFDGRLVRLNGKLAVAGTLLKGAGEVELAGLIEAPQVRPELGAQYEGELEVLYEDDRVVCVSKPRGLDSVVHEPNDPVTLADILAHRWPETIAASDDPRQSGLVQRLDFWSSGAILVAKDPEAYQLLRSELFEQRIKKTYLAITEGEFTPAKRQIRWPLAQSKSGKKMEVVRTTGPLTERKGSDTTVERLRSIAIGKSGGCIVRCTVNRAERHQVRCHLASAGNPLVGDELYGAKTFLTDIELLADRSDLAQGFFLHANTVNVSLPWTGKEIQIMAGSDIARRFDV